MGFNSALGKKRKNRNAKTIVNEEAISKHDNVEEEPTALLRRLNSEAAGLNEEKEHLVSLREKLHSKLQKEIKGKKSGIKKLRAEITELKIECEKLSISVRARGNLPNLERASKKTFRQTMKNKGYSKKAIEEMWKWYDYSEKKGIATF